MLNIFNIKLYKDYNVLKREILNFCNPRSTINEQRKKKLKLNLSDLSNFNKKFNEYLSNTYFMENSLLHSLIETNNSLNEIIDSHRPYQQTTLEINFNSLEDAINYTVESYIHQNAIRLNSIDYLNPHEHFKYISPDLIRDYEKYTSNLIKKFCLYFLFFEYNENPISPIKAKFEYDLPNQKGVKKSLERFFNTTIIIPFMKQHVSSQCSLVVDNKQIFGSLSNEVLSRFFNTSLDNNPYNYKLWKSSAYANDNRHTYTIQKFKEFLNVLHKTEFTDDSFQKSLKQEIFEFITNEKFILFNTVHSPLTFSIKMAKSEGFLKTISNMCCSFYCNVSTIPISEYRLMLSALFYEIFMNFKIDDSHDCNKWKNSLDLFLILVFDLTNNILPSIIRDIHLFAHNHYKLSTESPLYTQLNSDIETFWNKIDNNLSTSLYDDYLYINPNSLLIENMSHQKSFEYLHELIFNAIYFDYEGTLDAYAKCRFLCEVETGQINIANIFDTDTLTAEFNLATENDDAIFNNPIYKIFLDDLKQKPIKRLHQNLINFICKKSAEQPEQTEQN